MSEGLPEGVTVASVEGEATDRFLRLRGELGVTSFGINVMVLRPGERNRIHRHSGQEEVYLVLSGQLTLVIEGVEHHFEVGEIVRVAPEVRRQVANRGQVPVRLLALGGAVDREHQPRDAEPFPDWSDTEPGDLRSVPIPEDFPD